ncbi:acyl-CoA thioesterase domain-containing protein [Novosphingobium piscinae]|uniref:Thioesterase family protein n=1 Tax=Novosphingobium piscinae TaxID=1507448 RepID=A0A7X1KNS8_9SPHN|nr:acyl-CoA thioesterase domain-containing protein [Novosphingobium piscinae]MBC2667753.1 thioesterase family protein [Novosphingobium piscinae]
MSEQAYFRRVGDTVLPLATTAGYWRDDTIHGSAIVGLMGHEVWSRHGDDDWIPARFHVDMHRLAPARPVAIRTEVIREGRRLRLIEARMVIDGDEYARAICQLLRAGTNPDGRVWPGQAPWTVPSPDSLAALPGEARRGAEWRPIKGHIGAQGPRQLWLRQQLEIVAGEPLVPFTRVAAIADVASPWLHSADTGIKFINADVVVNLHRLPVGHWTGLEASVHDSSQGIAVGYCRLYDEVGSLGFASATGLASQRS